MPSSMANAAPLKIAGVILFPPRLLAEKAHHLSGGIWSHYIGIRAAGTPSRPGMTRLVDNPFLHDRSTTSIPVDETRVGMPASYLPPFYSGVLLDAGSIISRLKPLVYQAISVDRGDSRIAVPMEDDQWNAFGQPSCMLRCSLFHRSEGRGKIVCGAIGEARMHADGSIEVRIRCRHDHSHGPTSRHPGYVDPVDIDVIGTHNLLGDPGNEGWLTQPLTLVGSLEPIPAP